MKTRHRRRLASRRFPPLLAVEAPTAWRATENQRGNSRPDPAPGTRKSRLGSAENPRRTPEARLRGLRKERGTIFTPYRAAGRSGEEVACVSSQSTRSHRRLGLVYRATVEFRVLYCLFVIEHGRRRVLHFNVTRHRSADWVVQQWRESVPEADPYRYAILDRDSIFDADVIAFSKVSSLMSKRTSRQSPWQNGTAGRWIGSCR